MKTRIREFRARQKRTLEDLACLAGFGETTLFVENGKYVPSLLVAHAVARALCAGIDELFILDDGRADASRRPGFICRDSMNLCCRQDNPPILKDRPWRIRAPILHPGLP
jgi:DNA-binding XRE family transcriptional regulator